MNDIRICACKHKGAERGQADACLERESGAGAEYLYRQAVRQGF